jgi:DNA-binding winged helix-turn-helix (wHTH) protein
MSDEAKILYQFGPFQLDESEQHLQKSDGEKIDLRQQVFKVLLVLVENHGHLVKKEMLLSEVWGNIDYSEEGALSQCITALRKVLGDDAKNPKFIKTIPKRGFRFIAEVKEILDQETNQLTYDIRYQSLD